MRHSMRKNMNPEEAKLPENKNNAFASSVLLGLGVGLLPIVTQGLSYVMSYLSAAISINQGQLISSVSSMLTEGMEPSEIQNGLNSMAEFIQTPSLEFLFLGTDLCIPAADLPWRCCFNWHFPKSQGKDKYVQGCLRSANFRNLLCSTCNWSHRKRCCLRDYLHCYCCTLPCCYMDRIKNLYAR